MRKLSFGEKALSTACAAVLALACVPASALATTGGATLDDAPIVSFGKTYSDSLRNNDSAAYYEIFVPENGKLAISFGKGYASNTSRWYVSLWADDGSHRFFERRIANDNDKTDSFVTGVKPGFYYVKVRNCYRAAGVGYSLKTTFSESNAWEEEVNDSPASAKKVSLNKKVKGTASDFEDADWYKFTVPSKGYYSVNFGRSKSTAREHWRVSLYNSDKSTVIAKSDFENDKTSVDRIIKKLSKGTYYVMVTDPYQSMLVNYSIQENSFGHTYSLKMAKLKAPTAPKITKTSGVKKGGKFTWKKVKGASGYHVELCSDKNFSDFSPRINKTYKGVSGKSVSPWWVSGQKVYVRVRSYSTAANGTLYSKWSKVKSFTCK